MSNIYDIAQEVGVSAATVSYVLNGKAEQMRISDATQKRVHKAARDLGYVPNVAAKKLILSKGAAVPEIALLWSPVQHYFFLNIFTQTLQNMVSNGEVRGMQFKIIPFQHGELQKQSEILLENYCNGLIVPPNTKDDIDFLESININVPIIILNEKAFKFSVVSVDNYHCGAMAAELFHQRGHRHVAVVQHFFGEIHQTLYNLTVSDRAVGFLDVCKNLGIDASLQFAGRIIPHSPDLNVGKQAVDEMIQKGSLPTAIFALNDMLAIGISQALISYGVRIPEDVELVTFGHDFIPEINVPSITSFAHPLETISWESIRLMDQMLESPESAPKRILVDTPITYRQSCPETINEVMSKRLAQGLAVD